MKKILFICACLFLIGCQTNDEPVDDQADRVAEEDNQINNTDQDLPAEEDSNEETNNGVDSNDQDDSDDVAPPEDTDQDVEEDNSNLEEVDNGDSGYSSDDAIELVQEYIQGTDSDIGLNYSFDGEDDQGNYRIQVFEVVDHGDGESHTATYGWYLVDPQTGEITDMFD